MSSDLSPSTILQQPSQTITVGEAVTGVYVLIDVRSPKEFLEGALPEAVNIPVFDNEERRIIGTIYRHGGKEPAVEEGFALVQARIEELVKSFAPYKKSHIAIICARGGMRSRSIVNLLLNNGYQASQIVGGYKKYRHALLEELEHFSPRLIVLHGRTGTGKTRILQKLTGMIDLEDLAQHQSSLFGGLNRKPRTQKSFDSYLYKTIRTLENEPYPEPYFIEGESRQMGRIFIPTGLAKAMKAGKLVQVTASIETRVQRIVDDYPVEDDATMRQVQAILESLRSKMGRVVVDQLCDLLRQGSLAELVHILLVEHYDKRYDHCLSKYSYDLHISSEDITTAAGQLEGYRTSLLT